MDFHVVPRRGVSTPHPGEGCVQDVSKGGIPGDPGSNIREVRGLPGPVHLPARLAEGMYGAEHVHLIDGVQIHGVGGFLGAKVGLVEMPFQKGMEPVDYWRS